MTLYFARGDCFSHCIDDLRVIAHFVDDFSILDAKVHHLSIHVVDRVIYDSVFNQ